MAHILSCSSFCFSSIKLSEQTNRTVMGKWNFRSLKKIKTHENNKTLFRGARLLSCNLSITHAFLLLPKYTHNLRRSRWSTLINKEAYLRFRQTSRGLPGTTHAKPIRDKGKGKWEVGKGKTNPDALTPITIRMERGEVSVINVEWTYRTFIQKGVPHLGHSSTFYFQWS